MPALPQTGGALARLTGLDCIPLQPGSTPPWVEFVPPPHFSDGEQQQQQQQQQQQHGEPSDWAGDGPLSCVASLVEQHMVLHAGLPVPVTDHAASIAAIPRPLVVDLVEQLAARASGLGYDEHRMRQQFGVETYTVQQVQGGWVQARLEQLQQDGAAMEASLLPFALRHFKARPDGPSVSAMMHGPGCVHSPLAGSPAAQQDGSAAHETTAPAPPPPPPPPPLPPQLTEEQVGKATWQLIKCGIPVGRGRCRGVLSWEKGGWVVQQSEALPTTDFTGGQRAVQTRAAAAAEAAAAVQAAQRQRRPAAVLAVQAAVAAVLRRGGRGQALPPPDAQQQQQQQQQQGAGLRVKCFTPAEFAGKEDWRGTLRICGDVVFASSQRTCDSYAGRPVGELLDAAAAAVVQRHQKAFNAAAARRAAAAEAIRDQHDAAMQAIADAIPAVACVSCGGSRMQPVKLGSDEMVRALYVLLLDPAQASVAELRAFLQRHEICCQQEALLRWRGVDLDVAAAVAESSPYTHAPRGGFEDVIHKIKNAGQQVVRQRLSQLLVKAAASGRPPEGSLLAALKENALAAAQEYLLSREAMLFVVLVSQEQHPGLKEHLPYLVGGGDPNRHPPPVSLFQDWLLIRLIFEQGFTACATVMSVLGGVYVAHDRRAVSDQLRISLCHDGALLCTHLLGSYRSSLPSEVYGISTQLLLALRYNYDTYWAMLMYGMFEDAALPLPYVMVAPGEGPVQPAHAGATMEYLLRSVEEQCCGIAAVGAGAAGAGGSGSWGAWRKELGGQTVQAAALRPKGAAADAAQDAERLAAASQVPKLAGLVDRSTGTNGCESWFSELVAYAGGRKPSASAAPKQAPMVEWRLQQVQMPYEVRGYHLLGRRETRASYEHNELEGAQGEWNKGPSSFRSYKESARARGDAVKLSRLNVGVHRANTLLAVRQHNRRRALV